MLNVLVVDDEPFVRVAMASLRSWADHGYDFCYEASNGQQALDVLAAHPDVDIVLLDLSMPVMDGIQFLKALPSLLESAPEPRPAPSVIVLSAHDDFPMVRKAFHLGVREYLLKTEVDDQTLGAVLDKVAAERAGNRREPAREPARNQDVNAVLSLLEGPSPADAALPVEFPVSLWRIWIHDFDGLEARVPPEELPRFQDLFVRSIRQLLGRRGGGIAVGVERDQAAALTGKVEVVLLAKELKESLERYLSVRVDVLYRTALPNAAELREAWEQLGRSRTGVSRIVLVTKRYLREHFTRSAIPLDELAAHVGVSRNHLSWEFTRETGETITDHLARLRVEEACRLLATTTLKVYEISERVGYTNVEHFGRVFKRVTGTSPNRWAGDGGSKVFRDMHQ